MGSHGVCPSGTGSSHRAQCPPGSSTWWQVSERPSVLRSDNVPLDKYIPHCAYPFVCRQTRARGLLPLLAAVDTGCTYVLETLFPILWGTHPDVELLGCGLIPCVVFRGPSTLFSAVLAPLHLVLRAGPWQGQGPRQGGQTPASPSSAPSGLRGRRWAGSPAAGGRVLGSVGEASS